MDLFGMGMGEILLIALVALLVWGPEKLPEIFKTIGKFTSTLKKASTDLTTQVRRELDEEKKESASEPKQDNNNTEKLTEIDTSGKSSEKNNTSA
jgi:Tat protein translocase TatB subunit